MADNILDKATILNGNIDQLLAFLTAKPVDWRSISALRDVVVSDHGPSIMEKVHDQRVQAALIDAARNGDDMGRQIACQLIGHTGSSDALPHLIEILKSDRNSWVRHFAASALGRLGKEAVLPLLIETVASDNLPTSIGAAEGLALIGDPTGIEAVARKLVALANAGKLQSQASYDGGGFVVLPQYKEALEKLSSPMAAAPLVPALRQINARDPKSANTVLFFILQHGGGPSELLQLAIAGLPKLEESYQWFVKDRASRA